MGERITRPTNWDVECAKNDWNRIQSWKKKAERDDDEELRRVVEIAERGWLQVYGPKLESKVVPDKRDLRRRAKTDPFAQRQFKELLTEEVKSGRSPRARLP